MIHKTYYISVIIVAAIGILISLAIIPSQNELSYIRFKDKYFEKALSSYEEQYEKGARSLSVIIPLSKLYLQYGKIAEAIDVMEDYISIHPDSIEAKKQLGIFYQYDQRQDDYIRILEEVYALKADKETIHKLSKIYNFTGQYQKQISVLNELIDNYDPGEEDFNNLAYLYANRKEYDKAALVLDKLLEAYPNPDNKVIEVIVSIYIDAKMHDKALKTALTFANKNKNAKIIAQYTFLFLSKSAPKQALEFIENYKDIDNILIADSYLEVLVKQKDKSRFIAVFEEELRKENNVRRLKKMASIALNEQLFNIADRTLKKLLIISPGNADTYEKLGIIAYHQNNLSNAKTMFDKYFAQGKGSYKSNYYFAEVLWHYNKSAKAKRHFRNTIAILDKFDFDGHEALSIKSHAFLRLGNYDQSIEILHELLNRQPDNNNIKADLVDVLIDLERFDEAETLLNNI